jgi:ribosomal protein S18 acetylase RimI-like enzyme
MMTPATPADLPAVVALVNSAYRGDSSRQGWATEADYLGGQRTDLETLSADLAAQPETRLLLSRRDGELVGCVWAEPAGEGAWYVGMLTVRPDLQAAGLGRAMLEEVEALARAAGIARLRMTVIGIRESLIAWYARRGYHPTGETKPFPYGDERFGLPRRDDLEFVILEKRL